MRRLVMMALLGVAFALQSAATGDGRGKMSSYLRQLTASKQSAKQRVAADDRLTCVFVGIDADRADEVLPQYGCRVLDQQGDVFIVTLPKSRLSAMAANPEVTRLEAGRPASLTLDTTALIVGANTAHAGQGLPQAFDGEGVVVGVMDAGFDLTHPTFFDREAENYRVSVLWDMLSTDTVGSNMYVGRTYEGADELLSLAHSYDGWEQTHGTHTAGIVAGSGFDSPYRGIASGSELCLVANMVSDNTHLVDYEQQLLHTNAAMALGFKYIFDYAESQGKPCVISLSEGSAPCYDDDDMLYSRYLQAITGPGRILVAAAGNASGYDTYMAKPYGLDEAGTFVNSYSNHNALIANTVGPAKLKVLSYRRGYTDTLTIDLGAMVPDSTYIFEHNIGLGATPCTFEVYALESGIIDGGMAFYIDMQSEMTLFNASAIAMVLSGAEAEASLRTFGSSYFEASYIEPRWAASEPGHNVDMPAASEGVIAVGATIHRTGFYNYRGEYYDFSWPGCVVGEISYYSSYGPTLDGRTKPDVMAPGDNVVSSYNSYYLEANPTAIDIETDVAHFEHNGRTYSWNSNTGTSMATPVVAGAVALWLQAKPDLTPQEALEVIAATSRKPRADLEYPDQQYGYGEIDAYRGLLHLLQIDGIDGISHAQPAAANITLANASTLQIDFDSAPTAPFTIAIYAVSGALIHTQTIAPDQLNGTTRATIALPSLPNGIYAVQLNSADRAATGSTLVRI